MIASTIDVDTVNEGQGEMSVPEGEVSRIVLPANPDRILRFSFLRHARTLPQHCETSWSEWVPQQFGLEHVRVTSCSVVVGSEHYCQPKECMVAGCSGRLEDGCQPTVDPRHRRHPGCQYKDGHAFCGAWFNVDPADGMPHRRKANAVGSSLVGMDVDWATQSVWDRTIARIHQLGLAAIIHGTHSDGRPPKHVLVDHRRSFRVILRPSRDVLPLEWAACIRGAASVLEVPVDKATLDITRLLYLPSRPCDAPPVALEVIEGGDLGVDRCVEIGCGVPGGTLDSSSDSGSGREAGLVDDEDLAESPWDGNVGQPMDDELLEWVRHRLRLEGPAIDGAGGGKKACSIGALVFNDFDATWEQGWPLILEWNALNRPPWKGEELHHLKGLVVRGCNAAENPLGCGLLGAALAIGSRQAMGAPKEVASRNSATVVVPVSDDDDDDGGDDGGGSGGGAGGGGGVAGSGSGAGTGVGADGPGRDPKPLIRIGTDIDRLAGVGRVLLRRDTDEHNRLYQRGGKLVQVAVDGRLMEDPTAETIDNMVLSRTLMAHGIDVKARLSTLGRWVKLSRGSANKPPEDEDVIPPKDVADRILTRGSWSVPLLDGLSQRPILRPDGSIFFRSGYDAVTRTYSWLAPSLRNMERLIPESIGRDAAREAARTLLAPFSQFPFEAPHHKAALLALICTLVCRKAVASTVPFFGIAAPQTNSGKTLLSDCVTAIATGRLAAHGSLRKGDEEEHKAITTFLKASHEVVSVDNVAHALGGENWDRLATSLEWEARLMGGDDLGILPAYSVWIFNGINLQLVGDMVVRILQIKIDAQTDDPGSRKFDIKDLMAHVLAQRAPLVAAAITLVAAYIRAGRPDPVFTQAKFAEWNHTIRSAVLWAHDVDPCAGMADDNVAGDARVQESTTLVEAWFAAFGDGPVACDAVIEKANTNAGLRTTLEPLCLDEKNRLNSKKLGHALAKIDKRPFRLGDGRVLRIERLARCSAGLRWRARAI